MTRHYADLGSASDWLKQISQAARPIRNTTQISLVTRHQYGISVPVSKTTFCGETNGGVAKYRLFSHAKDHIANHTWKGLVFFQLQQMYPEPGKCLEHQKILKCPLEGHLHPKVTV